MLYVFIFITSLFYLLASFFLAIYLRKISTLNLRYAQALMVLGLLSHAWILWWQVQQGDSSFQNASIISNLSVTGLASFVALFLSLKKRALIISVIMLPISSVSMFAISMLSEQYASESLPSLWLWTHIGLMVLGELMFFVSATTAAAYLIVYRTLKTKHGLHVLTTVSSLPALDKILGFLLVLGFCLLSLGLVLGVIFAQQFWQGPWWRDPKVIFAGLIWVAYGFLISMRFFSPSFRGYPSAIGALIGFVAILFLSLGIDFAFSSQHQGGAKTFQGQVEESQ